MKLLRFLTILSLMIIVLLTTTGLRPLAPQAPLGAVIYVTIFTNEYNDSNTGCSLREAVQSANNDANFGGCIGTGSYGHDTIHLGTGSYLFSRGSGPSISEDANVYGDLDILSNSVIDIGNPYDVTIVGDGADFTIIDATHEDRVIDIQAKAYVKLVGVKIYRGHPSISDGKQNNGGGIYNHGTLRIEDCLIENNWGQPNDVTGSPHIGDGGGIWSDGKLTIVNSVFYNNRGSAATYGEDGGDGGGIYIATDSGAVVITNTTLYSNSGGETKSSGTGDGGRGGGIFNAGSDTRLESSTFYLNYGGLADTAAGLGGGGGGVYNYQGTITITNSTFYNNRSGSSNYATSGNGGGLVNNGGLVELYETTFTNNSTGPGVTYGMGGGIESSADNTTTQLHNTILAWNFNPGPPEDEKVKDCHTGPAGGNVFEARYSLIYDLTGCALDVSVSNLLEVNPLFGTFGYFSGPTQTVPLTAISPAIDAGDPASCPATDQRGWFRPVDGDNNGTALCDMGAYEVGLRDFLPMIWK